MLHLTFHDLSLLEAQSPIPLSSNISKMLLFFVKDGVEVRDLSHLFENYLFPGLSPIYF